LKREKYQQLGFREEEKEKGTWGFLAFLP